MKKTILSIALTMALVLSVAPVVQAQDEKPGDIAWVTYWKAKDGMEDDFEAGLAKHNEIHQKNSDPTALHTWEIVTGKYAGQYVRGSFGHHWADFDASSDFADADEADAAKNVDPYIAESHPVIYRLLTDITRPAAGDGPTGLARIVHFHVKHGSQSKIHGAIKKVHEAIVEQDAPRYYFWYSVVDGGDIPTYVLVLPRDNWAGFESTEPSMDELLAEAYGEEGKKKIWEDFGSSVREQHSATYAYRDDLSYQPAN